jgi:alpha-N-arabinofuranosidase
VLFQECGKSVGSISLHFLSSNDALSSPEYAYVSQMGYSYLFEDLFRRIHNNAKSKGIDCNIAITEHMIFNGRGYHPRPETLAEALSYAGMLNSAIRTEGIVEIYTHSAFLNHGGGMKKERGMVYAEPVYYALKGLQQVAGSAPVSFTMQCKFSDVPDWQPEWAGPEKKRFPLIDVMPLKKDEILYIIIINRNPHDTVSVTLNIKGDKYERDIDIFELTGDSFLAINDVLDTQRVVLKKRTIAVSDPSSFSIQTLPSSLYIMQLSSNK